MAKIEIDPVKVGVTECGWWRAHHQGDNVRMFSLLLEQNMLVFGLDQNSAKEAVLVLAESNQHHNSHDWAKAKVAVTNYYSLIKERTGLSFDPQRAAELEVGWWETHDELEGNPDKSALARNFAELYAEIFSLEPEQLRTAGEIKARATQEHDLAEDKNTSEEDAKAHWQLAEKLLVDFYQELKKVLAR